MNFVIAVGVKVVSFGKSLDNITWLLLDINPVLWTAGLVGRPVPPRLK